IKPGMRAKLEKDKDNCFMSRMLGEICLTAPVDTNLEAYIPGEGRVIGLSKLARIVNCFARRPQLQERLTSQVADFLYDNLKPQGVAVVVEAEHLCMTMRGARASGSQTRTSAMRGIMRSDARTRAEAMSLLSK
ncbi:MAG: GTP cyclohydrolase I, partial [Clostridia bacterium]|nr:GTP cyclohydrolase I [Clostridia bacterium]